LLIGSLDQTWVVLTPSAVPSKWARISAGLPEPADTDLVIATQGLRRSPADRLAKTVRRRLGVADANRYHGLLKRRHWF